MNLPTNKLRDLIAVLQTFDPDVEVPFTTVSTVTVPGIGRRCLVYDTAEPKFTEEEFLDKLSKAINDADITDDFYSLQGAADAIKQFYNDSTKLKDIHSTIDDVASDLKYQASRLGYL